MPFCLTWFFWPRQLVTETWIIIRQIRNLCRHDLYQMSSFSTLVALVVRTSYNIGLPGIYQPLNVSGPECEVCHTLVKGCVRASQHGFAQGCLFWLLQLLQSNSKLRIMLAQLNWIPEGQYQRMFTKQMLESIENATFWYRSRLQRLPICRKTIQYTVWRVVCIAAHLTLKFWAKNKILLHNGANYWKLENPNW